jgi:hypothetical protein
MAEGASSDEDVAAGGRQNIGLSKAAGSAEVSCTHSARTFTFVNHQDEHQARSHAMRESWRTRKLQKLEKEKNNANRGRITRTLVPKSASSAGSTALQLQRRPADGIALNETSFLNTKAGYNLENIDSAVVIANTDYSDDDQELMCNIVDPVGLQLETSAIALTDWKNINATVSLDPFDTFPVHLTSRHHELLHHCKFAQLLKGV